ncbi:helix-turn-helix domain-containing protein [Pedobacter psychroterrae]|uniref:DNA-binding protein n=1 Tax=Pedobacter psychroterrae TaxID=2530453 RepID=A0A4R0NP31_9SPHI|nr:helix-turn-helix domain-containing protein [Pedobacter psychroterrae]TCD02722.1 DNA-binding protein [Pedobacter psychroterrae]
MIRSLLIIIALLREFIQLWKAHHEEMRKLAEREVWHDTATATRMLRVGERTLNNYVRSGKLESKKIGKANLYLESSLLEVMEKKK